MKLTEDTFKFTWCIIIAFVGGILVHSYLTPTASKFVEYREDGSSRSVLRYRHELVHGSTTALIFMFDSETGDVWITNVADAIGGDKKAKFKRIAATPWEWELGRIHDTLPTTNPSEGS